MALLTINCDIVVVDIFSYYLLLRSLSFAAGDFKNLVDCSIC